MFGKKKKISVSKDEVQTVSTHVQTIPAAFYGGADPVIYHASPEDTKTLEKTKEVVSSPKAKPAVVSHPPKSSPTSSPRHLKKRWPVILTISGGLILATGVISWYYLRPQKPSAPPEQVTPKSLGSTSQSASTSTDIGITTVTSTVTTTSQNEMPTSTEDKASLNFPRLFLALATDLDNDSLTDIEEEIYHTDSGTWDTDQDGYYDGQEVVNLYNPAGTAPEKIVDSGLVKEYIHPSLGYRLYYPSTWEADAVDSESKEVLLSAITGEYISIHVFPRLPGDTFETWFARGVKGQNYSDLLPLSNRFQVQGWKRKDGLVGYFMTSDSFLALVYHPGQTETVLYPRVMEMLLQSFRPKSGASDLPVQPILPTSTPINPDASVSTTTP